MHSSFKSVVSAVNAAGVFSLVGGAAAASAGAGGQYHWDGPCLGDAR